MVYKKYIKRGGKLYGPYIYKSIKKDGKVITKYLGSAQEAKEKSFVSKKNVGINSFLFFVIGIFLLSSGFFVINSQLKVYDLSGVNERFVSFDIPGKISNTWSEINSFVTGFVSDEIVGNESEEIVGSMDGIGDIESANDAEDIFEMDVDETGEMETKNESVLSEADVVDLNETMGIESNETEIVNETISEINQSVNEIIVVQNETEIVNETIEINVTSRIEEILIKKSKIVIGKPVKNIQVIQIVNVTDLNVELPKNVENISIKTKDEIQEALGDIEEVEDDVSYITGRVSSEFSGEENIFIVILNWFFHLMITGNVIYGDEIGGSIIETENNTLVEVGEIIDLTEEEEVAVEYYTEAPESFEEEISYGKKIIVSAPDELNYTDVLAYTELPYPVLNFSIRLYHYENGSRIVNAFDSYDLDGDFLIDYVSWIVPHLSNQTYELVIEITKAEHLDSNRSFISDIYEEVKTMDDNWSEIINDGEHVRVTFEVPLDNTRDITIYARGVGNVSSGIEVYEEGGEEVVAVFDEISDENWYKVYLTGLNGTNDVFDLKVLGSVEFDYIVDPVPGVNSVNVTPASPISSDFLQGYCNASDGDNDSISYRYEWYKDDVLNLSGTLFREGSISAGMALACGIRANDSRVLCWGDGSNYQLGDNGTTANTFPGLTSDTSAYAMVSAGVVHSCGIRANDSRVLCWGYGAYYQQGDGEISDNLVPTLTNDTDAYLTIDAGLFNTCGIRANDSRVLCWGLGSSGEQGDGGTSNNLIPTLTSDTSAYLSVSCGGYDPYGATEGGFCCGIRANDSRVLCWGNGDNYEQGDGSTSDNLIPTLTSDTDAYLSVSSGMNHVCGIRANDSRVLCWGKGGVEFYSRLGDGETSDNPVPALTSDASAYLGVSAGDLHTCGIRANDSRVLCWGAGYDGAQGDGSTSANIIPTLTSDTSVYSNLDCGQWLGNGQSFCCGIRANDSRVLCWGDGAYYQQGDGSTNDNLVPTLVNDTDSYSGVGTSYITTDYGSKFVSSLGINQLVNTLPATSTSEFQNWTFGCSVYDGDSNSTWLNTSGTYILDGTAPTILITTLVDNFNSSSNTLNVNYTAIDSVALDSCWYSNDTMGGNTSLGTGGTCANITDVVWTEDQHNVTIWANDTSGNEGSASVSFTIDSIYPLIDFTSPTLPNATRTINSSVEFNLSVTETKFDRLVFNWDRINESVFWYDNSAVVQANFTNLTTLNILTLNNGSDTIDLFNDSSLVLAMSFDNLSALGENDTHVYDWSGKGNNGTMYNGTSVNSSDCRYGNCVTFDGSNDLIAIPSGDALSFSNGTQDKPFSISAWIKIQSTAAFVIVGKGGELGVSLEYLFLTELSTGDLKLALYDSSTPSTFISRKYHYDMDNEIGKWHHVAGTYDGSADVSGIDVYLDGVLVDDLTHVGTGGTYRSMVNSTTDTILGRYLSTVSKGNVDELRIYNRSLSAQEVAMLYKSNLRKYDVDKWEIEVNRSGNFDLTYALTGSRNEKINFNKIDSENYSLSINKSGLVEANYTYQGFVYDFVDNFNQTEERIIAVDTPPQLTIVSPTSSVYNSLNIPFSVLGDEDMEFCKYTLDDWITNVTITAVNSSYFSTSSTLAEGIYTVNFWCNDTTSNINNSESVNFGVDLASVTVSTTTGGGGGTTVVYNNIELVTPGKATMELTDEIVLPIIVKNPIKDKTLKGIKLSASSNTPDLSMGFDKDKINSLAPLSEENINMIINSHSTPGDYEIILNATVDSPKITETSRIYIKLVENLEGDFVKERVVLVQDLFKENPDCLEFNDYVLEAEQVLESEPVRAKDLLQYAINSCKELITSRESGLNHVVSALKKQWEKPVVVASVLLVVAMIIVMIVLRGKTRKRELGKLGYGGRIKKKRGGFFSGLFSWKKKKSRKVKKGVFDR